MFSRSKACPSLSLSLSLSLCKTHTHTHTHTHRVTMTAQTQEELLAAHLEQKIDLEKPVIEDEDDEDDDDEADDKDEDDVEGKCTDNTEFGFMFSTHSKSLY
ncbi:unnamed protein product [Camellia sinensis]